MLKLNEVEIKGINTHTKVDDENNETTKTLVDLVLPEGHPFALKTETNNDGDSDGYVRKSDLGEEVNDQLEHSLDYYVRKENLEYAVNDILHHSDVLSEDDLKGYVYEDDIEDHINQHIDSANILTEDNADEYLDLIDKDDVQRIVGEEILERVHRCAIKPMYRPDDPDADGSSDSDNEPTITPNTTAAREVKALELKVENLEDDLFNLKNEYEGLKVTVSDLTDLSNAYERMRVTVMEMYKSIRPAIDHYNYFQTQIYRNKNANVFETFEPDYAEEQNRKYWTEQERYEHESKRSDTAA